MLKILKISTATALVLAGSLNALEFTPLGYKAVSMGGAGVASAGSSMASYYNPALLANVETAVEISVGVGAGIRDNGAGESAQKLDDSGFTEAYERLNSDPTGITDPTQTLADIQTVTDSKEIVLDMNNKGLLVHPSAHLSFQVSNFGFGVYGQVEGTAHAVVDQSRTDLIIGNPTDGYVNIETNTITTQADYENNSMIYAVTQSLTYLEVKALALVEVPLSYGQNVDTPIGNVALGASLKFMHGTTYFGTMNIDTTDDITDVLSDSETKSSTIGIDLGLLYEPSLIDDLRVGLVAKNLNSPSFSVYNSSDYTLDPMIRVGIAYDISDSLEVAFDMDITENKTSMPGFDTQYIGGGINFEPLSWFNMRAGLMDNTASSLEGIIYTAGLAFGPSALQLDISGQYSSNETTVDGTSYPTYSKVNIAIISRW